MKNKRLVLTFLVIIPMLLGLVLSPTNYSFNSISNNGDTDSSELIDSYDNDMSTMNAFALSQDTQEGILNPNTMTQRGHQISDVLRARTDSGQNAQQNITIDEANDWTVSKTEIQVGNLRKLYAQNGTFENEVDPWTSSTYDSSGGDQVQSAVWNSTEGYVTLVNYGELTTHPVQDDDYTHHFDSEILWEQTITNSPQTDNFSLSFDYRYVSGPLDPSPYDLAGDVELRIYIHNDVYYMSLCEIAARNVWYTISDFPIDMTSAPASFDIAIGFYFEYDDLVMTENGDYNGDSVPDGLINAQKIELQLDDIGFASQTPIAYADVDLTFNVEGSSESITGPTGGIGTVTIENPSLWDVDPLEIEVTANTSVSFDYGIITNFQRDINSSWTTDLAEHGVSYSIDAGQSANLEMYSYIAPDTDYQNLTLEIGFPIDWQNTTIRDPLNNDITGLCTISTGSIFVPNSLYDRVGWWTITHQALNYAKTISIQIQDTGIWTENSLFRTSNITRTQVEIGTASITPGIGSPISIDWIMPNGTVWTSESVSSIIAGYANSSAWTLGGTNTSAGLWEVQIFWNNGTELAYGFDTFDLYHRASASVQYPTIETDHGLVIANQIIFTDIDTGEYLLDDSISITANWSDSTITFSPNFAKNWWQADFDTSLIQNGIFTVIVDISRPYFDPITTEFTVISTFETSLTITNVGPGSVENDLFDAFTVQLSYELWNGTGIEGALPSVTHTGPQEGIEWEAFIDIGTGLYSLDIISNVSTTYEITITLSKPYNYNASDSFTLSINEISTELILVNGTADVVQFGDSYRLVVEYRNSTGHGLTGANLQVVTITPSTGLINGSFTHITGGFYEITFTPFATGTYTIFLSAELFNHEMQYVTFTLTGVGIPTVLTALPSSVSITVNETFILQLSFEDESSNSIDTGTIELINLPSGISVSSATWVGNGFYNITIRSSEIDLYNLLFRASAINYQSSIVGFSVSVTVLPTELILENGTADVVQYGDSYRLVVEYRNSTGYGLTGANLQVASITPSTGLINGSFTHITGGIYEITFTPSATGTYAIVLSAELLNHEMQYTTFTLTGVVIPTVLTALPSSVSIAVNETFVLQLSFEDESSNPIDTATIELIDPPSGISVSSATWVGNGLYNITIHSSEIDIYNLLFRATATNYQSSIVGFTVSVTALPTVLDITNAGTIPVESGLNEVFTVQLSYELLNGTGVPGALPSFIFSGPAEGLLWYFFDSDNGLYSIDIICNVSATYGITITMSKPYYYNTTDSFTLIIGETGSELELLNGTADLVLFGDTYRLVVEYRNITGYGLAGSDLQVVTVTPLVGLVHTNFTHIVDGYYEIVLTPNAAGTFSIVISANITNHDPQYTTFTLTASGIPTILTSLPSEKTVAVNQTYTLQLRFIDESLNPLDGANISVISPPVGVTIEDAISVGGGYYNITVQSSIIQTYDLLFRAIADNYQSSSAGFTFVVTEIQTTLSFEDNLTSTVVEFAESFELIVYYNGSNPIEAVQGANITVFPAVAELDIDIVEYTGYYIITIRSNDVGSWALTILANKTDHRVATKSFFIEVEEIDTTVQGSSPLETLLICCSYEFTFSFIFESNSSYIRGATISPFGAGADWVTFVELGSGQYSVNLTPQELGEHSVIVTFEKIGFESASFRLTFNVGRVPITVEVLQGLSAPEYGESIVSVRVIEIDTGNPVSGVHVFCYIIDPNGARSSDSIAMTGTDTEGTYSTTISMPIAEGVYQLQITCDGANYVMNTEFSVDLEPERSITSMIWVTTTQYYPIILLFAALGFGLVYRKSARKKRIRENKETLAIKKRFDDIRSLMGVIVLHKESGLPVYSKILRDGLEEVVISAFITAITSFRGEFDIESSSEEWGLIPISDIIRVISTNKLVCAFITTGNPSPEQRERMIRYAKTVAFIFDETMEEVPIVVLDHHTTQQFNSLFEDILDGQLLRTYKLDDTKKFPTTSCANERIARRKGDEFKLEELASEIASCGLEEGRVYKAIMIALEDHFLVTTDDSPFATELLRAPDIIEEES